MNKPYKKKALGQHFLTKQSVVDHMIDTVDVTPQTTVMEIGCGDGFLTRSILEQTECKKLTVYEIDHEWVTYVRNTISDKRLDLHLENILDVDWSDLNDQKPWVLLANLPYQITFPILYKLIANRTLFEEGVVMLQEEVAQKIVATRGKKFSVTTILLQYHFDFKLMDKIEPGAFDPPPKVFSRLVYFKPKQELAPIKDADGFWKFLKLCFQFPRQTLKNNLRRTHFDLAIFEGELLKKRAQEISFEEFVRIWELISQ